MTRFRRILSTVQRLYDPGHSKSGREVSPALADLLQMPKSIRKKEEEEVAAYTARWLELADAALSATEKAAKALELPRAELHLTACDT